MDATKGEVEQVTDRIKGLIVTLKDDTRIDDTEPLMDAIRLLQGVADVAPLVVNAEDYMNRMRITIELRQKLWQALEAK